MNVLLDNIVVVSLFFEERFLGMDRPAEKVGVDYKLFRVFP